tara:strand:- start:79 stop:285 length:207 start_codon:yes stop_codon:yes gene_type:complete
MNYENGFYIYTPTEEADGDWNGLDEPQIIKILWNKVYVFNLKKDIDVDYVSDIGVIGKMIMNEGGEIQ